MVAASAIALAALVIDDLQRTVDDQTLRASAQARRDAERDARALRLALTDPAILAQTPSATRFTLTAGRVVVPDDLQPLAPSTAAPDVSLDVVAGERLRRALTEVDTAASLAQLAPLLDDPALPAPTRAWLRAHAAWRAHRGGLAAARDTLVAGIGDASPLASASALLLVATRDATLPACADAVIRRVPPHAARALCERLDALGLAVAPLRAQAEDAERRRDVLRRVEALAPSLAAAREPVVRGVGGDLLLYEPATASGALLAPDAAVALGVALLSPSASATSPAVVSVPFPPDAIPVVADALALRSSTPPPPGPFAGATGTALLIVALAMLCGAGSLLAFRAQRREASALRARTEFLTMVTHELKTPLAGLRLVGELLADGHVTDPAEQTAWLARLNAEAARLGLLIENVLDLGRLERGERAHAPTPLEVGALVAETAALFAPLAERDGLTLCVAPCAAPAWVAADAGALRQALLNLLDNARKYGRDAIEVQVAADDGNVVVSVRDHGDGVAVAEREAIFARFARGAGHRHGGIPGVGLGLHLARAIAARHGGTLVCRSPEAGPGARFELTLPALVGEDVTS